MDCDWYQIVLPFTPFGRTYIDPGNMAEANECIEVLEGPEVEISSYESATTESAVRCDVERPSWNCAMSSMVPLDPYIGSGPNNDIFEVDSILDGPKKRREHNFKVCYKVRWKDFGEEEDSWQPLSDLENVKYMIEEFKEKQEAKAKKKAKKEEVQEGPANKDEEDTSEEQKKEESKEYNPIFGSLKDTFWKKLELGLYDDDVFCGDMYSKVKGSRRAAHADAAMNIQKQQKMQQKSQSPRAKTSTPKSSKRGHKLIRSSSTPRVSSSSLSPEDKEHSPSKNAVRSRKRSSDPFSAKGYTSAKRSRRSRDHRRSSVTSVTVGIVSLSDKETASSPSDKADNAAPVSNPETCPASTSSSPDREEDVSKLGSTSQAQKGKARPPFTKSDSGYADEFDAEKEPSNKMTVTSETMLTVTTEGKRLEIDDVIRPEEIFKLRTDDNFLPSDNTGRNDGASGEQPTMAPFVSGSGGTSGGPAGPTGMIQEDSLHERSTRDTLSEASGAVERSHDEECLWGGACNRSDCRANRRRNMKNGKGTEKGGGSKRKETNSSVDAAGGSGTSGAGVGSSTGDGNASSHKGSEQRSHSLTSKLSSHSSSSSLHHSESFSNSGSSGKGHSSSLLDTSKQDLNISVNSDSSMEEAGSTVLSHDAIKDSFSRIGVQKVHLDTLAASASSRADDSSTVAGSRKGSEPSERPSLFSEDFMKKESIISRSTSSARDSAGHFMLPSTSGSINLSSPGKENSGSSATSSSKEQSGSVVNRLQAGDEDLDIVDPESDSSAGEGLSRTATDSREGWQHRKRYNNLSQPLEKIPSPNSRKGSDLDKRIATLTCDELEDFVEQGDEHTGHKEAGLVTNADLLQAVNLGKAEVVKRAINQSHENRLDFEQPDSQKVTLLMKAVQKGNVSIVEMLLKKGVNVNAQQNNGTTALMMAAELQKDVVLVALLLKYGANSCLYTVNTDQGETALMKAIKRQHRGIVNLMLRTGVNFAAPTCTSMSALELTVERRNEQIGELVRNHIDRLSQAFKGKIKETLEDAAILEENLFPLHCFPLRESNEFVLKFNAHTPPLVPGEGYLLFIAHTKINDKGVRCRFHGHCPIECVTLNGVVQSPLSKMVPFVTSCHPIIAGCNTLVIKKLEDYNSKAKLLVCAYKAKLLPSS